MDMRTRNTAVLVAYNALGLEIQSCPGQSGFEISIGPPLDRFIEAAAVAPFSGKKVTYITEYMAWASRHVVQVSMS